jgi:biopolymer transport protein ExbD
MTVLDLALPPAASGESGADVAAPVTPLNLVVVVAEAGVTVGGSGGFLPTVLRVGNVVDLGALASLLATVRSEHPAETRVTVASESAISYEEVVSIMDMCREQGFTEIALCALHESPVAGEGSR